MDSKLFKGFFNKNLIEQLSLVVEFFEFYDIQIDIKEQLNKAENILKLYKERENQCWFEREFLNIDEYGLDGALSKSLFGGYDGMSTAIEFLVPERTCHGDPEAFDCYEDVSELPEIYIDWWRGIQKISLGKIAIENISGSVERIDDFNDCIKLRFEINGKLKKVEYNSGYPKEFFDDIENTAKDNGFNVIWFSDDINLGAANLPIEIMGLDTFLSYYYQYGDDVEFPESFSDPKAIVLANE